MSKNITVRVSIVFLISFISQLLNNYHGDMPYDAWVYLNLAIKLVGDKSHPSFSLLHFDSALRGYLFPLMLLPIPIIQKLSNIPLVIITKFFGSLWSALLIGWLFPEFWQSITKSKKPLSWVSFLLFVLSFLLFWGDMLTFTLTDIPSFALLLLAIWSLKKKNLAWWLLSGLCLAAATNLRPVYVITIPIALGIIVLLLYKQNAVVRSLCLIGFFLGLSAVWLPQFYINKQKFGKNSPLVLGVRDVRQMNIPEQENLYLWHLNAGLSVQKFGPALISTTLPYVRVVADPLGEKLAASRQHRAFTSYGNFFSYLTLHLPSVSVIYAKHLFNGLDIDYSSPYVARATSPSAWYYWINYTLIFIGLLRLSRIRWQGDYVAWSTLLVFAVLIAISIPIVMETRFMLPLHLLLLAAATLGIRYTKLPIYFRHWKQDKRTSFFILSAYIFCIVSFFYIHYQVEALGTWSPYDIKV